MLADAEGVDGGELDGLFLHTYIQCVESIGAVGSVLQQILLGFGEFLACLVLVEAVASLHHAGGLNSDEQGFVVIDIKERHETVLAGKTAVDEQVLLVMPHRMAKIDRFDLPTMGDKLLLDDPLEIVLIDRVVRAERRRVIVEDDLLLAVVLVVLAEIVDEGGYLALELDIEGLDDIEPAFVLLSGNNPVYVGIVIHADADRLVRIAIPVRLTVHETAVLGFCLAETERSEVIVIGGVVLMPLGHGGIEAVLHDTDALAEDGRLEHEWRKVTLHVLDVVHADEFEVVDGGALDVIDRPGAQLVEGLVIAPEVIPQVRRHFIALRLQLPDALLHLPLLIYAPLNGTDEFRVHLFAVIEEPRALGADRHIRHNHDGVMTGVVPEVRPDTAVSGQRLVLEFLEVDELRLVDEQPVQGQGVGTTGNVLGDEYRAAAVVERDDMCIFPRLNLRLSEGLGRFDADDVMHALDEAHRLPTGEQSRQGVGQTVAEGRHDDAAGGAGHTLHVPQDERRTHAVGLAETTTGYYHRRLGADERHLLLDLIEIYF